MNDRRNFLKQAGLLAAGLPLAAGFSPVAQAAKPLAQPTQDKWQALRQQFDLDLSLIHI